MHGEAQSMSRRPPSPPLTEKSGASKLGSSGVPFDDFAGRFPCAWLNDFLLDTGLAAGTIARRPVRDVSPPI